MSGRRSRPLRRGYGLEGGYRTYSCKLKVINIERRLDELGLTLPAPAALPTGVEIPFAVGPRPWQPGVCLRPRRPRHGRVSRGWPFGKVPSEVTLEEAQHSARLAALAVLASLRNSLGDLDRGSAWLMVNGYVNAEPGYQQTTAVIHPFSELIIDLYGADVGGHACTAIGVATVPLNLPVVISAEVKIPTPNPETL